MHFVVYRAESNKSRMLTAIADGKLLTMTQTVGGIATAVLEAATQRRLANYKETITISFTPPADISWEPCFIPSKCLPLNGAEQETFWREFTRPEVVAAAGA